MSVPATHGDKGLRVGLYAWSSSRRSRTRWHVYEGHVEGRITFACGVSLATRAAPSLATRLTTQIVVWDELAARMRGWRRPICMGCWTVTEIRIAKGYFD